MSRRDRAITPRLFVGQLTATTSVDDLKNVFSKYGQVVDCLVHCVL